MKREKLDFYGCAEEIIRRMENGGVLCTVIDKGRRKCHDWRNLRDHRDVAPSFRESPVLAKRLPLSRDFLSPSERLMAKPVG